MRMRLIWWAALAAGISFTLAAWFGWTGPAVVAWKGAGVGLLALWAGMQARALDGWLIAAVLALGAVGDVLLDAVGLTLGAVFFLAGHLVAILLYARNRRERMAPSQRVLGWLLPPATVMLALACAVPAGQGLPVGLYSVGLGSMAAFAWTSRFPRYRVGLGAVLFVVSDLLIFSRMGPLAGWNLPDLLVWPLYFAGQAMIAWGVVATLRRDQAPMM